MFSDKTSRMKRIIINNKTFELKQTLHKRIKSCLLSVFTLKFQVVLERSSLRPGGASTEKDGDDKAFQMHVIQLVAIALLLTAL